MRKANFCKKKLINLREGSNSPNLPLKYGVFRYVNFLTTLKDPHDAAVVNTELFLTYSTEDKNDLLLAYHKSNKEIFFF